MHIVRHLLPAIATFGFFACRAAAAPHPAPPDCGYEAIVSDMRQPGITELRSAVWGDLGDGPAWYISGAIEAQDPASDQPVRLAKGTDTGLVPIFGPSASANDLLIGDLGTGPVLIMCGLFTDAQGQSRGLAQWDGQTFSYFGPVIDNAVHRLCMHTDASGTHLYAAGRFRFADGVAINGIARVVGDAFVPLGAGITLSSGGSVSGLVSADEGSGPGLYVTGSSLTGAGGSSAFGLARWDGVQWSRAGRDSGTTNLVGIDVLHTDAGDVPVIGWSTGLSSRVSGVWQAVPNPPFTSAAPLRAFAVAEFGLGGTIVAGSTSPDQDEPPILFVFDGSQWQPGPQVAGQNGIASLDRQIHRILVGGPATAQEVAVAGRFQVHNGAPCLNVVLWNGQALRMPWRGAYPTVRAMVMHDDGRGRALFVGGTFVDIDGVPAANIARFDGQTWSEVGGGIRGLVRSLDVVDVGDGPFLYATGYFFSAGGMPASCIARWDGHSWDTLHGGLPLSRLWVPSLAHGTQAFQGQVVAHGFFAFDANRTRTEGLGVLGPSGWLQTTPSSEQAIRSAVVANLGNGEELFAVFPGNGGGGITRGVVRAWNGASWRTLVPDGAGSAFRVIAAVAEGTPRIYLSGGNGVNGVGGGFVSIDGANVTRGFGGKYSSINVRSTAAFDQIEPPAVIVLSNFSTRNAIGLNGARIFRNRRFEPLGEPFLPSTDPSERGQSAAVDDQSDPPCVYIGGRFRGAGDVISPCLIRWRVCPPCLADWTATSDPTSLDYGIPDGIVDAADFFYFLDQFIAGNLEVADGTGGSDPDDPTYGTPDGVLDAADFFYYLDLFVAGC